MSALDQDTIVAPATPPGRGGIGIVRISGPLSQTIANSIIKIELNPRHAHYCEFHDIDGNTIDTGIALFFPGPDSFTGEDVVELQGHGGPILIDSLIKQAIALGARQARPGEFSERAFLNNKMDLTQAEAIADLINSQSEVAARNAIKSLQGEFSSHIQQLVQTCIELRVYIEAAMDFPEEEIDFLSEGKVAQRLDDLIKRTQATLQKAKQGSLLQEGISVVIAGKPNAGKSSLLNALAEYEAAIVTDIAGTTRDLLKESIQIDGIPIHIIDTAGLRESPDVIEQEGMRRAFQEIEKADRILLMIDHQEFADIQPQNLIETIFPEEISLDSERITLIYNKIDLTEQSPALIESTMPTLYLSAKKKAGIDLLRQHLKECMGLSNTEGNFTARRRHLDALQRTKDSLINGKDQLSQASAGELLAEDLKQAQQYLNEITGEFTSDDLLGEIFSSFCIGK